MAEYTNKLNLKKPTQEDFYNVEDFNENFDKIDEFADGLGDVGGSIGAVQSDLNSHKNNQSNPHNVTATQTGALPLAGGTLTGTTIGLGSGSGSVMGVSTYAGIRSLRQGDSSTYRMLRVINPDYTDYPLKKAAQLCTCENGASKEYNIYGEHNKPSALDVGAIPAKYGSSTDLNIQLQAGGQEMTVVSYNSSTKNTPKTQGLTSYAHGMVITNAYTDQYGVQICMPSGDSNMYIRKKDGTGIGTWAKVCNTSDIPTIPTIPKISKISTYVGNGTSGQSNPCTLTFETEPKFVLIMKHNAAYVGFFVKGVTQYLVASNGGFSQSGNVCSWSGNTLNWYTLSSGQEYQLNAGTQTYTYYVAY